MSRQIDARVQNKGSISPSTFRPTTAHYICSHGPSRPPAGKYSKAMANSDEPSTCSSAEETAHMTASQYCAFTREKAIKATEVTRKAQLQASYPQLPARSAGRRLSVDSTAGRPYESLPMRWIV